MRERIIVVGLNDQAAQVEVRERLSFTPDHLGAALCAIRRRAAEGVILSTCNRTEVYAVVADTATGIQGIADFLAEFHGLAPEAFRPYLYSLDGMDAVGHLFSVASGLDSMIVGEPQILGQVRQAYDVAASHNATGPILSRVFHQALKVGKQVRTETAISRHAVSISHAAVELARRILGQLSDRRALLVGAGKMGELAARNLLDNGLASLVVMNRTYARAVELAARFGGMAVEFARLPEEVGKADVVITSTGAPEFVLTEDLVREAIQGRPHRPLFLIDISVPRNVDPLVQRIDNVFAYDIDDLKDVCTTNLEERRKEMARARRIVDAEREVFEAWWEGLQMVPTIFALRQRAEEIRQGELQKALARLGPLSEEQRSTVEALTTSIVNKLLHQPTVRLKAHGGSNGGAGYVQVVRELFALDEEKHFG